MLVNVIFTIKQVVRPFILEVCSVLLENDPDSSLECDWFNHILSDLSVPQGKQEVAEMCFLLKCEAASLT